MLHQEKSYQSRGNGYVSNIIAELDVAARVVGTVVYQGATYLAYNNTLAVNPVGIVDDVNTTSFKLVSQGIAENVDVSAFNLGDILYVDALGALTTTISQTYLIGEVINILGNKKLYVKIKESITGAGLSASMQNDLGFNTLTGKIEQGYPLTRNTDTVQSTFFRRFTGSAGSTTFDSTGDVFIGTTALVSAPNTTSGKNARFYVRGGASVFDNAGVDGNEIVEFKTDRSWSIYQRGTAGGAKTQLMSNSDSKVFSIADQTNEDIIRFVSGGTSNNSSMILDKAMRLGYLDIVGVAGGTTFTLDDNYNALNVNTTNGPVTINLTAPSFLSSRKLDIFKFSGGNTLTIVTPSGLIYQRGAGGLNSIVINDTGRYTLNLRCDTANWFLETDLTETTRLVAVPFKSRTIVGASYVANATTTIEPAQVLIGSYTYTNTKSVPVFVKPIFHTDCAYIFSATGSYSVNPRFTISVGATNYLDFFSVSGGFFVGGKNQNFRYQMSTTIIPVAAGATIQIDFSASLQNIDASVAGTVSGTCGFSAIQLLVVNQ